MKILERLLGSKYDKNIPYTYYANYQVFEGSDEITKNWFGDTFCSVCNYLRENGVPAASVTIFECYEGNDVEMPSDSYTDENGEWFLQDDLCEAHTRYGSEGAFNDCKFNDRDKTKIS